MSETYQTAFDPDGEQPHVDYFARGDGIPSRTVLARARVFEDERFDEDLPLREDPHLWTRLLREFDAVRVDAPLATKQRRSDSITSDPEAVYQAEMDEIASLCEEYPELRPHRERREAQAAFRLGRQLLRRNETAAAREAFHEVRRSGFADARLWACLAVAYLPVGAPAALSVLERINARL